MHHRLRRAVGVVAAGVLALVAARPGLAAEKIKISAFEGTFVNFPVYVAKDLKIFEKHGIEAELIYGTGIQVANIMISGSADLGAFAVEHALSVVSRGQDVRLMVVNQTLPPFSLVVRNDLPTPNAGKPYPAMLMDLKGRKIGISTAGASTDIGLRFLLQQAGLDPQKDVTIVPVGGPSGEVASLKNGAVDAIIGIEPAPLQAVRGLKIGRSILDIEGGKGPDVFREYAYNAMFARSTYIKAHPQTVRNVVASIVEAERMINDPAHLDDVTKVAAANMRGVDPELLRYQISTYHGIFTPVATRAAIDNVNRVMVGGKQIPQAIPYETLVDEDLMPKTFAVSTAK
jgi:NitT/TauT family transport system substrate-binding protein